MRGAVAGANAARHAAALTFQARPWRGRAGSSTQSRPASLACCNGGWLRCSRCWHNLAESRNLAGAQHNAEAVEVNQDAHVHAVGLSSMVLDCMPIPVTPPHRGPGTRLRFLSTENRTFIAASVTALSVAKLYFSTPLRGFRLAG